MLPSADAFYALDVWIIRALLRVLLSLVDQAWLDDNTVSYPEPHVKVFTVCIRNKALAWTDNASLK